MKFQHLNTFKNYWYLPTLTSLCVFEKSTGHRFAEWFCDLKIKEDYVRWAITELVNTFTEIEKHEFSPVQVEWATYIDGMLREFYNDQAISSGG